MAINIAVTDFNKDGKGIDFTAYLAAFASSYKAVGYGGFNQPDADDMFKGKGYVTKNTEADTGGTSVIFTSSSSFAYDMSSHVVSGELSSISFGNSTTYDEATKTYANSSDIVISGFSAYTTSTADGAVMGDIMDARTGTLLSLLSANSISFRGTTGSDSFTGFGKNDILHGGSGSDYLAGAAGNDRLYGDAGKDRLYGGAGNDTVYGGTDNDALYGGSGNDKLYGGTGTDTLYGSSGNDSLYGDTGSDRLIGGSGNDRLDGGTGNDVLSGSAGNDTLFGKAGSDKLYGENGADKLDGGDGNDTLSGGAGNDRLDGGRGMDILKGGAGADVFYFAKGDGSDRIADFRAGTAGKDVIEFAHGLFDDFNDVIAAAKDTSAGVEISYNGGRFTLAGVDVHDLVSSDFHLL